MGKMKDRALCINTYGDPTKEEMEGGKKFDEGKERVDLIPPDALLEVGKVFGFGGKKYGDYNWEKGIKFSRLTGASMRHGLKFQSALRSDFDEESNIYHVAHKIANDLMLLQYLLEGRDELDDRYKGEFKK